MDEDVRLSPSRTQDVLSRAHGAMLPSSSGTASPSRASRSTAVSDFDILAYLDDQDGDEEEEDRRQEELRDVTARTTQYSSSTTIAGSPAPPARITLKRRTSSRSSASSSSGIDGPFNSSSSNNNNNDVNRSTVGLGWRPHNREVSVDIGLRGLQHSREASSTTTTAAAAASRQGRGTLSSPFGLSSSSQPATAADNYAAIYDPRSYGSSAHNESVAGQSRPVSTATWRSQMSTGTDLGTTAYGQEQASHAYDDDDDDRIHLNQLSSTSTVDLQQHGLHQETRRRTDLHLEDVDVDVEGTSGAQIGARQGGSRSKRRAGGTSAYYHHGPNLGRKGTLLDRAKAGIRRMSTRVVGGGEAASLRRDAAAHARLPDDGQEDLSYADRTVHRYSESVGPAANAGYPSRLPPAADLDPGNPATLSGRTLGIFGPHSHTRRMAHRFFAWNLSEPLILTLIIANVVILTIQSARSAYTHPRPVGRGYFHAWEDWVLFVLFIAYTLEILARIVVSGLVFDPRTSTSAALASIFGSGGHSFRNWVAKADDRSAQPRYDSTYGKKQSDEHEKSAQNVYDSPSIDRSGSTSQLPMLPYTTAASAPNQVHHVQLSSPLDASNELRSTALDSTGESPKYPPTSAPATVRSFRSDGGILSSMASATAKDSGHSRMSTGHSKIHRDVPFVQAVRSARQYNASQNKAFLRHSWNRVDLVAVASFWICFILAMTGAESRQSIYIFRALSTLRAARLLTITTGTTTILRSLKQSAPLMVNVAFFVVFAMALFSIVGVQSFKGSFERNCVWIDPAGQSNNTLNQMCGGHVDPVNGDLAPFFRSDGSQSTVMGPKGFICPLGQLCIEGDNPYNGTESFDNVAASLLQVVVITSANTWTTLMYSIMDAEYMISSLFFIACLVITNFWLMNIFVAVILNTFGNIREETRHSAFAGDRTASAALTSADPTVGPKAVRLRNRAALWKRIFRYFNYAWIAVIVADVGVQASKTAQDSPSRIRFLNNMELYFTLAFFVEIVIRFAGSFPDYRSFVKRTANMVDLFLVGTTCIIQIPLIRNSDVYPWLTVFQLMRFYRVILAFPRMRPLLAKLMSSIAGLVNMVLFLLLMNFLAAVIAVQFLRGGIEQEIDGTAVEFTFYQIYNSFLAIYVIFSSENWTDILYAATGSEASTHQAVISAIFLAGWFLFANFILLQMFIAVINEGFAIAEEEKHKAQMQAFVRQSEPHEATVNWVSRLNPYRYVKARPKAVSAGNLPSNLVLPLGKATIRDFMSDRRDQRTNGHRDSRAMGSDAFRGQEASTSVLASLKIAAAKRSPKRQQRHDRSEEGLYDEDEVTVHKQLDLLKFGNRDKTGGRSAEEEEELARQADFITAHPSYDRSLWIFTQSNPIRKLCQRIVEPSHGQRIFGLKPYRTWAAAFKVLILCAIAGSVAVAAIATPVYRRQYYVDHQYLRLSWFNLTEASLGLIFVVEFLIKVVADGFIFSPNAYLLSVWNLLDFFVLVTLVVNIGTSLSSSSTAVNSFTRALKAFRALRLINLSSTMRTTFYNVMIVGASKIFDASILTVLYIIPFAIWGQNLFSGLLYSCNDGSALSKSQCIGEYMASPSNWEFLAPRAWQNPYVWSFDSFRSALLILFEIVSLEGWVNVMQSAMAITGRDQQAQQDAAQYNSIFFVIYNLIGAIVVLTLFVSVIIENFTIRSGMALLTTEQRQWVDLKKLILRQRPAKRPKTRPSNPFRAWCFDRTVHKNGWWSRTMTTLYVLHIAVLMSQADSQPVWADTFRDYIFLCFTLIYAADVLIRCSGLGWRSFLQNGWNVYDVFVVTGTFATTVPLLLGTTSQTATQLQKLFLVSIAFKLVQKNDSLNQLFKTAIASLPAILNIFGLWLTLFLVWAIFFLEIFSLTRWSVNETNLQNYSTFPKTMLMLVLMSTGEGWNAFMHDYTIAEPLCSPSQSYLFSDCGSPPYAFVLFITWNVISMYIFLNMLTGVVVENFSFVFSLYGRVTSVSRQEMRAFKKAWAIFDRDRTGYLRRRDFVPFFSRLSGVFEVRIYPDQFRVENLRRAAMDPSERLNGKDRIVDGLNVSALDRLLDHTDYAEISRRKKLFNRLYQDALLSEDPYRGISFTNMLLLLAQYKLVDTEKALQLDDLMQRKERAKHVDDLISLDRVRVMLRTLHCRRQFLEHREKSRQVQHNVPTILLDDDDRLRSSSLSVRRRSLTLGVNTGDTSTASVSEEGAAWASAVRTSPISDNARLSPRSPSPARSDFNGFEDNDANDLRLDDDAAPRASMGDDFTARLEQSDWARMMDEELANAETQSHTRRTESLCMVLDRGPLEQRELTPAPIDEDRSLSVQMILE